LLLDSSLRLTYIGKIWQKWLQFLRQIRHLPLLALATWLKHDTDRQKKTIRIMTVTPKMTKVGRQVKWCSYSKKKYLLSHYWLWWLEKRRIFLLNWGLTLKICN
jgi:hypothetical protein